MITYMIILYGEPRRSDELALQKGEIILIMDKSSDGWWKGQVQFVYFVYDTM